MKLTDWIEWKKRKKGDVAKDLGIHRSYLSRLLTGERRCPPELAQKIEQYTDGQVTRVELVWPE